jgi:hypothetical protein
MCAILNNYTVCCTAQDGMPGMKRDMSGSASILCAFVAAVKGAAQSVSNKNKTAQTCWQCCMYYAVTVLEIVQSSLPMLRKHTVTAAVVVAQTVCCTSAYRYYVLTVLSIDVTVLSKILH